jgi:hypothetical protein
VEEGRGGTVRQAVITGRLALLDAGLRVIAASQHAMQTLSSLRVSCTWLIMVDGIGTQCSAHLYSPCCYSSTCSHESHLTTLLLMLAHSSALHQVETAPAAAVQTPHYLVSPQLKMRSSDAKQSDLGVLLVTCNARRSRSSQSTTHGLDMNLVGWEPGAVGATWHQQLGHASKAQWCSPMMWPPKKGASSTTTCDIKGHAHSQPPSRAGTAHHIAPQHP